MKKSSVVQLGLVALSGLALRLVLAWNTYGTNDVASWEGFMDYIVRHDTRGIYKATADLLSPYNHPPFMSFFLLFIHGMVARGAAEFTFLIRLPAMLGDFLSTLLSFFILRRLRNERIALQCATLISFSPALIFISGFHGNTDPLFMAMILFSMYLTIVAKRPFIAGLALGLALNIKMVPVLVVPIFLLRLRRRADIGQYLAGLAIPVLSGYAYHLVRVPSDLLASVFLYSGLPAIWGVTSVTSFYLGHSAAPLLSSILKLAVIAIPIGYAGRILRGRERSATEKNTDSDFAACIGMTFLTFLVLTPGFGVQYLAWFAVTSVFLKFGQALVFHIWSGVFLFQIYTFWSDGIPWNYANSFETGHWPLGIRLAGGALWLYLTALFCLRILSLVRDNAGMKTASAQSIKRQSLNPPPPNAA